QPPAHPALAVLEPPRQLLERQPEALAQLRKQPRLVERVFARPAQPPLEQQRLDLVHRPARPAYRVACESPERAHALVAVDDDKARRVFGADDDDRQLLAELGERRHELALLRGLPLAQPRVAQLELV